MNNMIFYFCYFLLARYNIMYTEVKNQPNLSLRTNKKIICKNII